MGTAQNIIDDDGSSRALHRFAIVCAGATFVLIFVGGLVTSTGSALAVPDWPLAYGRLVPKLVGGVRFEYGHRVVAGVVVMLTIVLAGWTAMVERRSWVRKTAFAAAGVIVLQAILGGITVLYLLPLPVAVAHAGTAQALFCLMVAMALFTNPNFGALATIGDGRAFQTAVGGVRATLEADRQQSQASGASARFEDEPIFSRSGGGMDAAAEADRHYSQASSAAAPFGDDRVPGGAQFMTGEADAQSDAGAREADRQRSQASGVAARVGKNWISDAAQLATMGADAQSVALATIMTGVIYIQILIGAVMRHLGAGLAIPDFPQSFGHWIPPFFSLAIGVNFAHRCGAAVVSILVLWTVARIFSRYRDRTELTHPALLLAALLIAQITLGALTIWSGRAVLPTTTHVAIGAAVLATSLALTIRMRALGGLESVTEAARVRSPISPSIERKVTA